jgi:AraC-like DNA-binding protein
MSGIITINGSRNDRYAQELSIPDEVNAGDVTYPVGGTYGPRFQNRLQLVLIYNGSMTAYIDGNPLRAGANTVSILFPGLEEFFAFSEESETWHSWLDAKFSQTPDSLIWRLSELPRTIPLSPTMDTLVHQAVTLIADQSPESGPMLKALAAYLFWLYISEATRYVDVQHATRQNPALNSALRFIQANLSDQLTLKAIADAAVVSPAHLIRIFRTEMNTTPIAYMWIRRVQMGVDLLKYTGLKVSLIAEQCGFQTYNHFSRRVRMATGLSPLEIRKHTWE